MEILSSSLHHEQLNLPFTLPEQWERSHQVVAILTGGAESLFVKLVQDGKVTLQRPIYLVASGTSNSLAASMEILSWIKNHGGEGRILTSAKDIEESSSAQQHFSCVRTMEHLPIGGRIGLVGNPSDWLISSLVGSDQLRTLFDVEPVEIPIDEVSSLGHIDRGEQGAMLIYERMKEIVQRYHLDGVTLRCFDLLTTLHNTGCLALARLNADGIPAACEGDVPALLTMMLAKNLTHQPAFQANPARINPDGTMLFAHCTIPYTMVDSYEYTTHFESGIGVAIHGELPTGDYTLMKLGVQDGQIRLFHADVQLTRNQYEPHLCRTQVWLQADAEVPRYFFNAPIANHHILVRGHWSKKLAEL